jgi:hypothetical protein
MVANPIRMLLLLGCSLTVGKEWRGVNIPQFGTDSYC